MKGRNEQNNSFKQYRKRSIIIMYAWIYVLFISCCRRHSQPYLTKVQNQAALKRRQSIHGSIVHPKNDSKINASSLMSRRNKRYSVANAVMVTGVTEALLLGLLSKDKKDKDDDLCSLISSASELFTSLDVSDSVTDLTSDDSIKNKTLREKHNVSEINKRKRWFKSHRVDFPGWSDQTWWRTMSSKWFRNMEKGQKRNCQSNEARNTSLNILNQLTLFKNVFWFK